VTAQEHNEPRKVVPRWRSLAASAKQGEIGTSIQRVVPRLPLFSEEEREWSLAQRRADWIENRSLAFAEDLVSTAFVLDQPVAARDAALEILADSSATGLARSLATRLIDPTGHDLDEDEFDPFDVGAVRAQVVRLKRRLRNDPRAALTWAEIARTYAALGQGEKASDAMSVALAIAPEDRFLLRSAARLGVELKEPDRAHHLLATAPQLREDPWLLSAEIAIAPLAGRTSRHQGHARRLLASGRFLPHVTSELASALGTEALTAGDRRSVRRFLSASLEDPTENAVAQAEWVSRQDRTFEFDREWLGVEDSFEARAHFHARQHEQLQAIENARAWLREQPFAKEPAIFGSYRAALAGNFELSAAFCEVGLQANPKDYMLRNNLVFALASSGRVAEARKALDALDSQIQNSELEDDWGITIEATRGLVAFREGDVEKGRRAYERVIRVARERSLRAVAAIIRAREELAARTALAADAVRDARRLSEAAKSEESPRADDVPAWLEHIEGEYGTTSRGAETR